ncbi:MAG: hypothetical protein ACRCX2_38835 [Paraclostridium sp.]
MKNYKHLQRRARLMRLSLIVALAGLWIGSGYLTRALCTPEVVANMTADYGATILPYMFLALIVLFVAFGVLAMIIALVAWIWGG